MRETFVPLFQDIRASSLWAHDSDIRMVWITLLTMVDPEGYVCAAIPGIAVAANVPVAKVREAIAIFESPDPDSRSTEHEGRRIEKVPRGWRLLNYAAIRERARHEAEKARKRRWAQLNRAGGDEQPVLEPGDGLNLLRDDEWTPRSEPVDASKSKSGSVVAVAERVVVKDLRGWDPSPALRADAIAQGVPNFDERLAELRRGPIGGQRGVFRDELDDYVRGLFPKWRTWRETDAHKASKGQPAAEAPRPIRAVPGCPHWVKPRHQKLAKARGVDIVDAAKGFELSYHHKVEGMKSCDLFAPFMEYLKKYEAPQSRRERVADTLQKSYPRLKRDEALAQADAVITPHTLPRSA